MIAGRRSLAARHEFRVGNRELMIFAAIFVVICALTFVFGILVGREMTPASRAPRRARRSSARKRLRKALTWTVQSAGSATAVAVGAVAAAAGGAAGGLGAGVRTIGRGGEMLGRAVVAARAGGVGARRPGPEPSGDAPAVGGVAASGSSDGTRRSSILGFSAGGRSSVGAVSVR